MEVFWEGVQGMKVDYCSELGLRTVHNSKKGIIRKKWRGSRGEQLVGRTTSFVGISQGDVGGRKSMIVLCDLRYLLGGGGGTA